jgi:hypothetical protein
MAGLPGSTPAQIPAGQDELVRRIRDLERRMEELGPSVARSFGPVLDALIQPEVKWSTASAGFALTTSSTVISTVTFTVPTGYTRAAFVYNSQCSGTNGSGVPAFITIWPSANSGTISQLYQGIGPAAANGATAVSTYSVSDLMTGLVAGASLSFVTEAFVNASGFGSSNQLNVGIMVLWMR